MPPRSSAVPNDMAATVPTQRDQHLQCIVQHGRRGWQNASGYNWRALIEADVSRYKRGDRGRAALAHGQVPMRPHSRSMQQCPGEAAATSGPSETRTNERRLANLASGTLASAWRLGQVRPDDLSASVPPEHEDERRGPEQDQAERERDHVKESLIDQERTQQGKR